MPKKDAPEKNFKKNSILIEKNEVSRKILSHSTRFFEFSLLHLSLVYRESNGRNLCGALARNHTCFCHCNTPTAKRWQKPWGMNNQVMFVFGFVIFVIYVYFLLSIIKKQNQTEDKEVMNIHDLNDLDGMGNQGRIPDKKPKNRAI